MPSFLFRIKPAAFIFAMTANRVQGHFTAKDTPGLFIGKQNPAVGLGDQNPGRNGVNHLLKKAIMKKLFST
jgi:hypothetical protein